jgi:uncharacterized protein YqgC (DUF456 family)
MLIFDFSLSNVFYFIGFFILLLSLGMGIIRALQGKKPIITLRSLSLKEIARHVHPTNIDTVEKIPMALSHIPLIGNFVAAKYGASFSSGERFATWSVIIGIVFFWIDPSMTLVIILASLVTLWITYQSISLAIDDSISLLGDHLPHAKTVHIFLLSLIYYTKQLITSTHTTLPHWQHIISTIQAQYILEKKENVSQILALPLLNIVYIIKNIHTPGIKREIVQ